MKGQTHGGKGSTPRPTNKRRFDENYEAIFNKKAPEERVELDEGVHTAESDGRQRESKLREHVEGAGIQGQADQKQAVEPTTVVLDGIPTEEDAVKTVLILEWFSEAIGLGLAKKWEPSKSYDGYKVVARIILPADQKQAVEPYPIAWMYDKPLSDGFSERTLSFGDESEFEGVITPLYAHPPKRQPLSDSVIERIIFDWDDAEEEMDLVEFARAIEAAHSITGDEHAK